MNILFVCSGNSKVFEITPFIKSQGDSICKFGHSIDYFSIKGKGLSGYLKNVKHLKLKLQSNNYDLIHAHYSLCGFVSCLASSIPVVTSLLGSDVNGSFFWRFIINMFSKFCWSLTIVKSDRMKKKLGIPRILVIPNGVDLDVFKEMDKVQCRDKLGLEQDKQYILFPSEPERKVKNYSLAKRATDISNIKNVSLITIGKIPHNQIPIYINASDLMILTSISEGSPNVIKEAMACNCPIVSTDVGDVKWLLDGLDGCYIVNADPQSISGKIILSLEKNKKTEGRKRLIELGLDSETVAKKIIGVYESVLNSKRISL